MKEYDFTTLAGFKEAAEKIARKGNAKNIRAYLGVDTCYKAELYVDARLYNEQGTKVWDYRKGDACFFVPATPETLAEAAAELETRVDDYENARVQYLEEQVRDIEAELAKAKARLAQAQEE